MIVKLLTEHHFEFLSLKGGCRGSSESTLVKMSICWKSHAAVHIVRLFINHKNFQIFIFGLKEEGHFCRLPTTFANSLDLDQDRQNVDPHLDPNYLTL